MYQLGVAVLLLELGSGGLVRVSGALVHEAGAADGEQSVPCGSGVGVRIWSQGFDLEDLGCRISGVGCRVSQPMASSRRRAGSRDRRRAEFRV